MRRAPLGRVAHACLRMPATCRVAMPVLLFDGDTATSTRAVDLKILLRGGEESRHSSNLLGEFDAHCGVIASFIEEIAEQFCPRQQEEALNACRAAVGPIA